MKAASTQSIIPEKPIASKIYEIRGHKVMLDSDLATLYDVGTKALNQAIRRNFSRFPENFMFQLTEDEWYLLRSHFVTSKGGRGGRTYLPNVFTEHGVLMISSVLNNDKAVQMNIRIVRVFSHFRQLLNGNNSLKAEIEDIKLKIYNYDKNIEVLFNYLDELAAKIEKPRMRIGYRQDEI